MEPLSYYAERNFKIVLIKLPEHIPEIQENSLLQKYAVFWGDNYDSDNEENNNGDTRVMVSACEAVSFIRLRKSKNGETEGI
jgi:hypothetical protein